MKTLTLMSVGIIFVVSASSAFASDSFIDFAGSLRKILVNAVTEGVPGSDCQVLFTDGAKDIFSVSIRRKSDNTILAAFAPAAPAPSSQEPGITYNSHSSSLTGFGSRFTYSLDDNGFKQSLNYKKNTITITSNASVAACKIK